MSLDNFNRDVQSSSSSQQDMMLSLSVRGHRLAVPVSQIRDVVTFKTLTSTPLAQKEVLGVINVRGHIVTIIDCDSLISQAPIQCHISEETDEAQELDTEGEEASEISDETSPPTPHARIPYTMCVTFEHKSGLYALAVDQADDLFLVGEGDQHPMPATLPLVWQHIGARMVQYNSELVAEINLHSLVDYLAADAAPHTA